MKNIRFDGPGGIYAELEQWSRSQQGDNSETLERLRRNLRLARERELTPRQAEMLRMHFDEGKSMRQIARELGVAASTVSRTIARAEKRLRRCLRYGF
ncbi:MAG: sigma-70 family RNA polymerase sigma factor [Oscillospiraceae bacterium]